MKKFTGISGFSFLLLLFYAGTALADCGCKSDCGKEPPDLRRVKGTPWESFMKDVKADCRVGPISAYRRPECQRQLYECIMRRKCGTVVGRPGYSPHETGIALDYSNKGRIRSCMEKARQKHVASSNFGRPHPGQHIDNGGRGGAKPGRQRAPEVEEYREKRKSAARQRRIEQHRQRKQYNERTWMDKLWNNYGA